MSKVNTEGEHIIGTAIMNSLYDFTIADEPVYTFFGERVIAKFTAYIHPDDRQRFIDKVENRQASSSGEDYVVVRVRHKSGKYVSAVIFIKPSTMDADKFCELEIYDIVYLVSEYKKIYWEYKKTSYTMQLMQPAVAFDFTPSTGFVRVYTEREIVSFEGSLDKWYEELVQGEMIDKMQISILQKTFDDIKRGVAGISCRLNMRFNKDDKKFMPVFLRTANIYDSDNASVSTVVGIIVDDESGESGSEKIYSNSNLDPLTGLYNKTAIKAMAENAIRDTDEVISYIMLDLDHFKEVNDNYGHMFGDEVIFNAARIIKDIVGKRGYVGRVGGDEFFIVLKGVGSELDDLRPILRAIRAQIEWAYKGKLGDIKLTTSIGCANFPKDADNYNDLFKLADHCLYIAKMKGRNRFIIYNKDLHGTLDAIKSDDNQIKVGRSFSDLQKLEFVTDAINKLNDWRSGIINSVLKEMLGYFRVDEISIYNVKTGKAVHSSEEELPAESDNICKYFGDMKSAYRESNVFAYGDVMNLKMPYPEFYDYTERNNIYSFFSYAIKQKGEITHIVAVYTKGRYEKWSDVDINFLNIIFKTMGDKILNS